MKLGAKRPLEETDMYQLSKENDPINVSFLFRRAWSETVADAQQKQQKQPSAWRAMVRAFYKPFAFAGVLKAVQDAIMFTQPIFMNRIIQNVEYSSTQPASTGYLFVAGMFFSMILQTFFINAYFARVMKIGMQLRAGLVDLIYTKAMSLSSGARQSMTIGEITTLMSIDSTKLEGLTSYLHIVWSGSLQIIVALALLYWFLGPATFAGVLVMLVLIPTQMRTATVLGGFRKRMMRFTDKRVKVVNEVLQGIRVIKYFAWEKPFLGKISQLREEEVKLVKKIAYVKAVNFAISILSPVLVALVTFETYVALGNELNAATVFTSLSLFNIMRFPLQMLPIMLAAIVDARVSLIRLSKFLNASEIEASAILTEASVKNAAVVVRDASFTWASEKDSAGNSMDDRTTAAAAKRGPSASVPSSSASSSSSTSASASSSNSGYEWSLSDINLVVPKGKLVAIVGAVGSGKSSILSALLGEMRKTAGTVELVGDPAYVPQEAWIQNATLRDNVLFCKPMDELRYEAAIDVCALRPDLEVLPAGDSTEIGERGINLSGGQKQRVNLARAVYSDADILLMDDCLSAVDPHVARHIFEKCVCDYVQDKTRILVTHQLQFVHMADLIVVMDGGRISEVGSYDDLMQHPSGTFRRLISTLQGGSVDSSSSRRSSSSSSEVAADASAGTGSGNGTASKKNGDPQQDTLTKKAVTAGGAAIAASGQEDQPGSPVSPTAAAAGKDKDKDKDKGKITTVETRETGAVSSKVVKGYIVAGGGVLMLSILLGIFLLANSARIVTDVWLALWSADAVQPPLSVHMYMMIYGLLALALAILELIRSFFLAGMGVTASIRLHLRALTSTLRGRMSYFDATPMGRILNRFSKDVEGVDQMLLPALQSFLSILFNTLMSLMVCCYILPFFMIPLVPALVFYYFAQKFYRSTSRELKRLDSITRSPLYSHFSETLGGISTIRAYRFQGRFQQLNLDKLARNLRPYWLQIVAQRWLSLRLDILAAIIVGFCALFIVMARSSIDPGLAGLALLYTTQLTGLLNWVVRMATDAENQLNSVERLLELANDTPQERSDESYGDRGALLKEDGWPRNGLVDFDEVEMRYREDRPPVLTGISLRFNSGEKIGVVGRTGAGKSSLLQVLFRMVEPSAGQITIDHVDICAVPLTQLRSNALTIIPQEPFLFSGTIRSNLDPFGLHEDQELWECLRKSHLKTLVEGYPLKLEHEVSEYGQNFSVGQRQLFCLSRAMLRKGKVLVLDEATANVDVETDVLIQDTIRSEFADRTVVTIAHRLNTIIDYDRIVVLDQGRVVEFDSAYALLTNHPDGPFGKIVAQTGKASSEHLLSLARMKAESVAGAAAAARVEATVGPGVVAATAAGRSSGGFGRWAAGGSLEGSAAAATMADAPPDDEDSTQLLGSMDS